MNNQELVRNIEDLSTTLNQDQLIKFLDIMDAMSVLLATAQSKTEEAYCHNKGKPTKADVHQLTGTH